MNKSQTAEESSSFLTSTIKKKGSKKVTKPYLLKKKKITFPLTQNVLSIPRDVMGDNTCSPLVFLESYKGFHLFDIQNQR